MDTYLASLPEDFRTTLQQLRGIIKRTAPDCTERVNYLIPIFRLKRDFAAMKEELAEVGIWI